MREKKPRTTLIKRHKKGCWALAKYGGDWIVEGMVWLQRDRLHRRRSSGNRFLLFRCNDAACAAEMIMLEADVIKRCEVSGR